MPDANAFRSVKRHRFRVYAGTMQSDELRTVEMHLVGTGSATTKQFTMDLHARSNSARVVRFGLQRQDAEALKAALERFLST